MHTFWNAIRSLRNETANVDLGSTMALTWFGRPNSVSNGYKYWIGTTKDFGGGTFQSITEYNEVTDSFTTTQVGTVSQKDDHNQTQILIRQSDNRIIAFYVEHNGSAIRYKISDNPLDASSFGQEITLNPFEKYSYISPYQKSNGDIFIFFRYKQPTFSEWGYMKSTDGGLTFGSATTFIDNGSTRPYVVSCQNNDEVHFALSQGHPQSDPQLNVNVYHFYFDMTTETFKETNGGSIVLPIDDVKPTLVESFSGNDSSWILDISFKNDLPRLLYCKYPEGRANQFLIKELFFVEYDGTNWINNTKISETLNGYIEDDVSIQEEAYDGASRFDVKNPDIIWMPKQVNGILEIHKVNVSNINNILIEQITFDSTVDNWRPISINSNNYNLLWLVKNNYNFYTDYDMNLIAKTQN